MEQSQDTRLLKLLNIAIITAVFVCIACVVLVFTGYGTIRLHNIPVDATIRINDHVVTSNVLKVRPGDYTVSITAPSIMPYYSTAHVTFFQTTAITPHTLPRSVASIFSSVLGADINSSVPPQPSIYQWFDNGKWLVGILPPDSTFIALKYDADSQTWSVGFATIGSGYPHDITQLPTEVATYIQQQEAKYAQQ
jgi:hypothetical protein